MAYATFAAALLAATSSALADQRYDVSGDDVYQVGGGTVARITYTGTEELTVERDGKVVRYSAYARYVRNSGDERTDSQARFVQELLPSGSFEDRVDEDPDFLTVLNQPFAVQLDPATLHDLRTLHAAVPFNAASPLGGDSILHGFLSPGTNGEVDGQRAVAVRFEAEGVMTGALPAHAGSAMSGQMRMEGTAYYAAQGALLLALNATLTIVAQLHDPSKGSVPVHVVYRRAIRANAKTPRPAPLPTDAGTESPATP